MNLTETEIKHTETRKRESELFLYADKPFFDGDAELLRFQVPIFRLHHKITSFKNEEMRILYKF